MLELRLFDLVYQAAGKHPKKDAVAMKKNDVWEKISSQTLIDLVNKISRGLLKLGVNPQDKIALISSNNRTEWILLDIAIQQIGAISIPIYPTSSQEDYLYIFNNSEVKFCFLSDEKLYQKVKNIHPEIKSLIDIFTFDKLNDAKNWNEILILGEEKDNEEQLIKLKEQVKPDDVMTIIYTSGTTGNPKGVMLSHRNIVSDVLKTSPVLPTQEHHKYKEIKSLSFLPICHVFERMLFYFYVHNGISVYFAENMDKLGENLQEIKPNYLTVVPRIVEKLYTKIYEKGTSSSAIKKAIFLWALSLNKAKKSVEKPKTIKEKIADKLVFKKWREALGGNIITIICGSATLSSELNKIFQNAGISILEGYGLTETSPVISVNHFHQTKPGSVGKILENLDVKFEQDGEITLKGDIVMKGYYKDEQKTKEAFTDEGYFKTGDIGHLDEDGYLYITDRKKEMFKTSGGKYIAPQIIENQAILSKFIEQIMVVGDGEKMPCALIQPNFDFVTQWANNHIEVGTSHDEIAKNPFVKERIEKEIEKLNTKLGNWERIKKIELTSEIWSVDNGLLTPTLKLKRKVIKQHFIELYNKMYGHDKFEF